MKSILLITLLFCLYQEIHGQLNGGNVWVVATNVYQYQENAMLTNLDYSSSGAHEFAQLFDSRQLVIEAPKILVNRLATRESILEILNSTFISNPRITKEDLIIFYFSGHGGMAGEEIGICPYDYGDVRDLITDNQIITIMNNSIAKHKICFLEACKSNIIKQDIYTPNILISFNEKRKNIKGGLAFMTSSEAGKETYGLAGESGFFTNCLLKGLNGEADNNKDKIVSISELFNFIESGVKQSSKGKQTPQINTGGFDPSMPVIIIPESFVFIGQGENNSKISDPPKSKSEAADKDCESHNVGDYCFCNTTNDNFIVSINANGVALNLSAGQTQCLYNYTSGSYNYHLLGTRDYGRGQAIIYGVSNNFIYVHDRGQFLIEKCKSNSFIIK